MDAAAAANIFGHSPGLPALRARVRRFVDEQLIPHESAALAHGLDRLDALAGSPRAKARAAGVYAPPLPAAPGGVGPCRGAGGVGLGGVEREMMLLEKGGRGGEERRGVSPLVRGRLRSCFAMTEPAPGAGSDPAMLQTCAQRRGAQWLLDGKKWFISGAVDAAFAIVLARTGSGATLFIVDADNPGYRLVRNVPGIDSLQIGGHGEIALTGCAVGPDAVLGEVGQGWVYAQARLEPARIAHCMRFIGRAARAMEIAQEYVKTRQSFGQPLAALQQVQAMVADAHIDLHASRLMTWHVAALMDAGQPVKQESALAKVFVSEAVNRVADRAAQMMGALGMSQDTPVSLILRELRPFRIYDGASEVHRSALARRILQPGKPRP